MGLERKAVLRAAPAHTVHYERRRPEETILHCLVREHLETFLAQVQARTGMGLPEFVKDEFEAFFECDILAHGFLRMRCADCAHRQGGQEQAVDQHRQVLKRFWAIPAKKLRTQTAKHRLRKGLAE